MRSLSPKRVQKTIRRLQKEIGDLDEALYDPSDDDPFVVWGVLERKRDDMVRAAVLQLHTSIEDLLTVLIHYAVLDIHDRRQKHRLRSERGKAFRRMLYDRESLGFDMKLNFALGVGLISPALRRRLMELNTVRNKCSHHWRLNDVARRGKRPAQLKPPLLQFRGQNLHKVPVLKQFTSEFETVYLRLYLKWVS
jgi:hypothetical protein